MNNLGTKENPIPVESIAEAITKQFVTGAVVVTPDGYLYRKVYGKPTFVSMLKKFRRASSSANPGQDRRQKP